MYSDSDFDVAARRSHSALVFGIALICVFLALVIVLIVLEMEALTLISAGLGFIICYFLWSFKVMPWVYYGKYMKELKNGRRRQMDCELKAVSDETRMFDNIEVRDVLVSVGEAEEDERLFVLDADKTMPPLEPGDRITVTSYGNFITDIAALSASAGTSKIDLAKQ